MDVKEQIAVLEQNVRTLLDRYATLQTDYATLLEANKQQREELMRTHAEFVQLSEDFKNLKLAHALSADTESKEKAKREITKLISLVDEALENLSE